MSFASKRAQVALGILSLATIGGGTAALARVIVQQYADASHATTEETRTAFSHNLPPLDGNHLKVTVVEVTYGPGESDPPHSHPCAVIGYVIAGSYRSQIKGQAEVIYHAGESFYEAPNGVHQISANPSDKVPVKFLAYFVCDHDTPLTVASLETKRPGGK
jgi:quercetin dioxygenase-like cupin family protein